MFEKKCDFCGRKFSFWEWWFTDAYKLHVEYCRLNHYTSKVTEYKEERPLLKVERPKAWPSPPPPKKVFNVVTHTTPERTSHTYRTERTTVVRHDDNVFVCPCDNTSTLFEDIIVAEAIAEVVERVFEPEPSYSYSAPEPERERDPKPTYSYESSSESSSFWED